MTHESTIDRVAAALLRALEHVEKHADTIFTDQADGGVVHGLRAGAAMMREQALIEVQQEFNRGALWTAKHSHGGRYIVEHLDGGVLDQRRGISGKRFPIYFKTKAAAERRAFELNEAIRKAMTDAA